MAARTPRVLFVVSEYVEPTRPLGGIFFRDQARVLNRLGVRADVAFVEPRSLRGLSLRALRESRFQVTAGDEDGVFTIRQHGWNPGLRTLPGALVWARLMERLVSCYITRFGRPDLVHAQGTVWAGHVARRLRDRFALPYVVTEYSSRFLMRQIPSGYRPYIRSALSDAERVMAVSAHLADAMRPFAEGRSIEIVPNIVDVDFFVLGPPKTEAPFVFLAVAHMNANKGHDILVRAFASAFAGDSALRLVIAGDGPERARLETMARDLGIGEAVRFPGLLERNEVRGAMHEAHALVHPSYNETFGIVLVEAMATGIPVIATRCGGPEEFVTPEVGLLVEPGDVGQLTTALQKMRREKHAPPEQIRQHVTERFGAQIVGRRLASIYEDAIHATGRSGARARPRPEAT